MDSDLKVFAGFYFTLFVIFGAFFVLNLILAVIMEAFSKIDDQIRSEEAAKKTQTLESALSDTSKKNPRSNILLGGLEIEKSPRVSSPNNNMCKEPNLDELLLDGPLPPRPSFRKSRSRREQLRE